MIFCKFQLHLIFFQNDQVLQGFSVDKGEFTCPLCRQFANSVLPCYPGNNVERSLWQSHSNKCMQDLVQEVEDLQEQLGTFPVSISVRQKDLVNLPLPFSFYVMLHLWPLRNLRTWETSFFPEMEDSIIYLFFFYLTSRDFRYLQHLNCITY